MKNWVRYTILGVIGLIAIGVISLASLSYYWINYSTEDYSTFDEENWVNPLEQETLQDNQSLYQKEVDIQTIYLTILPDQEDEKTFTGITRANDAYGETDHKLDIYFETEDRKLIENGFFQKEPNATIEIKGKSSQDAPIKSFKVRLQEKAGLWNGQNIINLNKDYADSLRIRNKIAYDIIAQLDDVTSFQTQFVRVFIKDLSSGDKEGTFEDYGFFTHVEQPNKLYLKNHHIDPSGHFYLVENFNFEPRPDVLRTKDDPAYDKKAFEQVLDIRGSDDHRKLLELIDVVNDPTQPIDEIMDKYFEEENYLTWLAINLLLGNHEVASENYLLYSSLNSQKWFFIPYDFNNALGNDQDYPAWQDGIGMFWNNSLHRRYLQEPEHREALNRKIEEVSSVLNEETMKVLLDEYEQIVMGNLSRLPDFRYLTIAFEELLVDYEQLPEVLDINRYAYEQSLLKPMPFDLVAIDSTQGSLKIEWEKAYDLEGRQVTYEVILADDEEFEQVVAHHTEVADTHIQLNGLKPGTYYLKIIARNIDGQSQLSMSEYKASSGEKLYGVERVTIKKD